ncbi:MAG: DNA double-strand break repair nuclease NurA [SAR202 cluster bacterium]|nr:DNA double-strand break repair nuclease NurA [SAR202 cluster bacterium]
MSLDIAQAALQIDDMAYDLVARRSHREQRLQRAVSSLLRFPVEQYADISEDGNSTLGLLPGITESPAARCKSEATNENFSVAAADGSHIDIDRHLPVRCFLINTGIAALNYGDKPDANLYNNCLLYGNEDALVIHDPLTYRRQTIEGTLLSAKRAVEEIRALTEAVENLSPHQETLALLDGSLIMLGLVGPLNQEFVLRALVEEGFAAALDELGGIAKQRRLALASYISMPGSTEIVNAIRTVSCHYGSTEQGFCGSSQPERGPCDNCVDGIRDREIFERMLSTGERSATFTSNHPIVTQYYGDNGVAFFYINVGEEIARVEVPSWVAKDKSLLNLTHTLILDQCKRGQGYPVALMEAHEQAVINGADRRFFVQHLERVLYEKGLPTYTSEKVRSKRVRAL